ncbi:hypothetical protein AB0E25_41745 [Streptomyces bobili]|uniref:hypothetical protein n=1 Tax=Streptomyces bobili TaxID=67280 RepID=UPI0033E5455D
MEGKSGSEIAAGVAVGFVGAKVGFATKALKASRTMDLGVNGAYCTGGVLAGEVM